MAATFGQLVEVRSQKAQAMVSYLRAVEGECGKNALLERFGRRLDELRVPLRVVPHEPVRDIEEIRAREHFRQTGASRDADEEESARRIYRFRHGRMDEDGEAVRRAAPPSRPEPLDELEPKLEMAVILGDPGSGKTEWLKYRARRAAREAREKLENFEVGLGQIIFPVWLRLRDSPQARPYWRPGHLPPANRGCGPRHEREPGSWPKR